MIDTADLAARAEKITATVAYDDGRQTVYVERFPEVALFDALFARDANEPPPDTLTFTAVNGSATYRIVGTTADPHHRLVYLGVKEPD